MIIIQTEKYIFDVEKIRRGGFLIAKSKSWDEPRNCLVVKVTQDELKVLFLAGVNAAVSYLKICAEDVAKGDWELGTGDWELVPTSPSSLVPRP